MKRPPKLTANDLWKLLGEYAFDVGECEGVLFTDNPHILEAEKQFREETDARKVVEAAKLFKHPGRYPTHDGDKGQVFGGTCNITACNCDNAVYFNPGTYGYYCPRDAHAINYKQPLCVIVDHQLTLEEMTELHIAYMLLDMR